jgi:hypothetical protein
MIACLYIVHLGADAERQEIPDTPIHTHSKDAME